MGSLIPVPLDRVNWILLASQKSDECYTCASFEQSKLETTGTSVRLILDTCTSLEQSELDTAGTDVRWILDTCASLEQGILDTAGANIRWILDTCASLEQCELDTTGADLRRVGVTCTHCKWGILRKFNTNCGGKFASRGFNVFRILETLLHRQTVPGSLREGVCFWML